MNSNEKKALISFLLIYVGSSLLFLAITLYVYYHKELKVVEKECSMQMISAAHKIRGDILNSYMSTGTYTPKSLPNPVLKIGLFDYENKALYSELSSETIKFDKEAYETDSHAFHVHTLEKEEIPIKYIVIETTQGLIDKLKLQHLIWIVLGISAVFISIIGYFLSNLLLKPVREKIEHMDKFIKDSAHELNTPIAVLRTSISMLNQGKNPQKMLGYINSSAKQISEAFNDLHFAVFHDRQDSMDVTFDLGELCSESVDFFTDIAASKKITIEAKLESLSILMDRSKAQKVINNLISNAIKYSPINSKIIVSVKNSSLSVQDFGIGMSQEDQKKVFKRYERGVNNEGGFGIGLDILSRICNEYGIIIHCQSELKKGSTFSLNFKKVRNDT